MSDHSPKDDEAKSNEKLKRMLKTPPKPHKPKPDKGEKPQRKRPGQDSKENS